MLPAGGSCLLGSINLAEFASHNGVDFSGLQSAVKIATKALNDVLDEGLELHPLQEQRDSVRDWRQIGLGIFGLADALIKMGIRYGSDAAIKICDLIGYEMINDAMDASNSYDSPFVDHDPLKTCKSIFFNENYAGMLDEIKLHNSQLLTIAPTGTLSTMLGVSGGILLPGTKNWMVSSMQAARKPLARGYQCFFCSRMASQLSSRPSAVNSAKWAAFRSSPLPPGANPSPGSSTGSKFPTQSLKA